VNGSVNIRVMEGTGHLSSVNIRIMEGSNR